MENKLEAAVKTSLVDGYLPCPVAFKVAQKMGVTPGAVGDEANRLKIRIINCQLGCFKIEKALPVNQDNSKIAEAVAEKIKGSLVNDHLPCAVAFEVGKEIKVTRQQIGDAANKLKIKIKNCQLGCF